MNARGTRGPRWGGAGRSPKIRRGGGRGGKSSKGCLVLALVGSGLMIASGVAGLCMVISP